eukprot:g12678.t1
MPELPRLMGRISLRLDQTEASKPSSTSREEDTALYRQAAQAEQERQRAWRRWVQSPTTSMPGDVGGAGRAGHR